MWTWLLLIPVLLAAVRDHDRGLDDRLGALPALPRRGDHLDGARRRRCSTRRPVLYPITRRCADTLRDVIALNPLTPIFDARAAVDHRSERAVAVGSRPPAARSGFAIALAIYRRRSACSRCGCSAARRRGSPRSCERPRRAPAADPRARSRRASPPASASPSRAASGRARRRSRRSARPRAAARAQCPARPPRPTPPRNVEQQRQRRPPPARPASGAAASGRPGRTR